MILILKGLSKEEVVVRPCHDEGYVKKQTQMIMSLNVAVAVGKSPLRWKDEDFIIEEAR